MKTKNILKHIQIALGILTILVSINGIGYTMVVDEPKEEGAPILERDQTPQYVQGEVLVKFKEGADPSSILKEAGIEAQGIERIHSIKPAVTKFRKDYKLEKDPKGGWYSLLSKQYKEVADIPDEEMFKEAYAKMPEVEKSLYRSYKINLPEGMSVEEAINKLRQDPDVEYAEPNYIMKVMMVPNDPYYSSRGSWGQPYDDLWGIKNIQTQTAWDMSQGAGVVVAVIDTGVDYSHPDLAKNIWVNQDEIPNNKRDDDNNGYIDDIRGWDFAYNDNNPMDVCGHGTHVAGTVAAVGNNGMGVIGVAPAAKIMIIKGLNDNGEGDDAKLASCIFYAANNGAHILSNSWGGYGTSGILTDAFHYAHTKNSVCLAAAGNSNDDVINYTPANINTVLAVAASTQNDEKCYFSNYGLLIGVAAPGGGYEIKSKGPYNILSTMADNSRLAIGSPSLKVSSGYWRLAGTSMACPHAAGVTALIRAKYPTFTNEEVMQILKASSDDKGELGFDIYFGHGRVNAHKAAYWPERPCVSKITEIDTNDFYRTGYVAVYGAAYGESFRSYMLRYKRYPDGLWKTIDIFYNQVVKGKLCDFDVSRVADGKYLVELIVNSANNKQYKAYSLIDLVRAQITSPYPRQILDNDTTIRIVGSALGESFDIKYATHPEAPAEEWKTDGIVLANEGAGPIKRGLLATWDLSFINETREYFLKLTVYNGEELKSECIIPLSIWTDLMMGWPVQLDYPYKLKFSSVILADLDTDGKDEIIFKAGLGESGVPINIIYVLDSNGKNKRGWPLIKQELEALQAIAVGDLDKDNDLEIVSINPQGQIYAYHHDGSTVAGWPQSFPTPFERGYVTPVLADVDADDFLEIIYLSQHGKLYVYNHNGTQPIGWPQDINDVLRTSGYYSVSSPAVADVDNDGDQEIVVTTNDDMNYRNGHEGYILVFHHNGVVAKGWPARCGSNCVGSPVIADIDNNGKKEILLQSRAPFTGKTKVFVWNYNGTNFSNWPRVQTNTTSDNCELSVSDIDQDGNLEIITSTEEARYADDTSLTIWKYDGTILSELRLGLSQHTSSNIVCNAVGGESDVMEIISLWWAKGENGLPNSDFSCFTIVSPFGDMPSGWLRNVGRRIGYESSPAVGDINGDGKLDCIFASRGENKIYALTFDTASSKSTVGWPMCRHDPQRTGYYKGTAVISNHPPVLDPIGDKQVNEETTLTFTITASDPDNDELMYSTDNLPQGATFNPDTRIFAWTPTYNQAGIYEVRFSVSDGLLADSETIQITVINISVAPYIANISPGKGVVNTPVTLTGTNFLNNRGCVYMARSGIKYTPQILSWSDTQVRFKVPKLPSSGQYSVWVVTTEGKSNSVLFYFDR